MTSSQKMNSLAHIHEAGHAVAALYYEVTFKSVDIISGVINHVPGHYLGGLKGCEMCIVEAPVSAGKEGYFKRDCIIYMAGIVSEAKYKTEKFNLSQYLAVQDEMSDIKIIKDLSKIAICDDDEVINSYLEYVAALTVYLFDSKQEIWEACKAIASALSDEKSLSHKECLSIYNENVSR